MSYEAIRWAMGQPVKKSSAKFVLVAMANCVNGEGADMQCWPSVQHLADTTGQDRKTVMDGLRRLREAGFINDTGERRGATGQVPVYLLNSPETGTVGGGDGEANGAAQVEHNSTKNGTGAENGTVPKTDTNSTVFPNEQYQIPPSTVPKTGHGTSKEPGRNQEGTRKRGAAHFDASLIDLPDWLERAHWCRWCKDRKTRGKGITEDAAHLQLKTLHRLMTDGYAPEVVIDNAIENGWQGLYEPKGKPKSGKHAGFSGKNYREGISADGSFN